MTAQPPMLPRLTLRIPQGIESGPSLKQRRLKGHRTLTLREVTVLVDAARRIVQELAVTPHSWLDEVDFKYICARHNRGQCELELVFEITYRTAGEKNQIVVIEGSCKASNSASTIFGEIGSSAIFRDS